jgi:hypothetical protein
MTTLFSKLLAIGVLFLALCGHGYALPPLGLTQVSADSALRPNLEVIDGIAYLGVTNGVWTVDSLGTTSFQAVSHPTLGTPSSVTRVVKATDNQLYVAASYGNFNTPQGGALYNLEQLTAPFFSWLGNYLVNGVDKEQVVYGNVVEPAIGFEASKFHLDGSVETLRYPPGSSSSNNFTRLDSSTPNGYAFGGAGIPGTAGESPVVWTPGGDISFVIGHGIVTSSRDRSDGQETNFGVYEGNPTVKLGQDYYYIEDMNGNYLDADFEDAVKVSHDDFVVVHAMYADIVLYGFFPGIVPDHPNRALPLLDIFPELASIDIDVINDLASVDGYLYMTLSGSDGTFLFGARDPSVIPEPATAVFALLAAAVFLRRARPTIS